MNFRFEFNLFEFDLLLFDLQMIPKILMVF